MSAAVIQEDRLLMTFDLDFADIRKYPLGTHAGIVVFRLTDQRWRAMEAPARRLVESGLLETVRGGNDPAQEVAELKEQDETF